MDEVNVLAKRSYVAAMRLIRDIIPAAFLYPSPLVNRNRHWLQSLLAIHDLDEMIRLDVPWWTYGAIEAVEDFLSKRERPIVFEYGSGASTVWLAKRAERVLSVEHDREWWVQLKPKLTALPNVHIELIQPDGCLDRDPVFNSFKEGWKGRSFREYSCSIHQFDIKFDLIVIDGRARCACLLQSISQLAPGGIIVFDNSHRARYHQTLKSSGLYRTVMRGLVPSLPFPDETSLLFHPPAGKDSA